MTQFTTDNYEVDFVHADSYDWFRTKVYWVNNGNSELIGYKTCCKNYKRSAKWANRIINNHKKSILILDGKLKK